MEDKNHWYDGILYDLFIAPNQDKMFNKIIEFIKPDDAVIDVGCGTGRFSFKVVDKCAKIKGIDLSAKNIKVANKNLLSKPNSKISFKHNTIKDIINSKEHYDVAVITYVIHEVNEDERLQLIEDIFKVADKIIIGDYLIPQPKGFWKLLNNLVEFVAGSEHYNNFISFKASGGLAGLIKEGNYKLINEIINKPFTSQIILIKKGE